jgi:D-aminopeptidase
MQEVGGSIPPGSTNPISVLRPMKIGMAALAALVWLGLLSAAPAEGPAPRARDLGVPFDGTPGPNNAITDVAGVEVGFKTLNSGEGPLVRGKGPVRTGVTAIFPRHKTDARAVFAGFFAGNGNGDMTGTHWVEESGVLETPILITGTGSVGVVRDAAFKWLADHRKGSFWYPIAAETADVPLNDMAGQHVTQADALEALDSAKPGPVAEGNVGGGTGMVCNGFKGGTGTASRRLSAEAGGYMVGVLAHCNFGSARQLRVAGIPVAREMTLQPRCVTQLTSPPQQLFGTVATLCNPKRVAIADGLNQEHRGSIIIVIATDAPLTAEQLKRLARRASVGLGRLGAIESDGSGDIFIAFSTANAGADDGNWAADTGKPAQLERLRSAALNPLFEATVQSVEESVVNALVAARTMTGADYWTVSALPHDQLQDVLRRHGMLVEKGAAHGESPK